MDVNWVSNNDGLGFDVTWYVPEKKTGLVKITSAGIVVSKEIIEQLKNPKNVAIGYDLKKRVIIIKPMNQNDNTLTVTYGKGAIKMGTTRLVESLVESLGLNVGKSVFFKPLFTHDESMIYFYVDKPYKRIEDK